MHSAGHGGRGVASALLGWVVGVARSEGVTALSTHAGLTARPFFAAHGVVVDRAQRPVLRGVELTNVVMRQLAVLCCQSSTRQP